MLPSTVVPTWPQWAGVSLLTSRPAVEAGWGGLLVFAHHGDDTVVMYVPWHLAAHEGDEGRCRFFQFTVKSPPSKISGEAGKEEFLVVVLDVVSVPTMVVTKLFAQMRSSISFDIDMDDSIST